MNGARGCPLRLTKKQNEYSVANSFFYCRLFGTHRHGCNSEQNWFAWVADSGQHLSYFFIYWKKKNITDSRYI